MACSYSIGRGEGALEALKEFTDEVVLAIVQKFHLRQRDWQLVHINAQAAWVWPVLPGRPRLQSGVHDNLSGRSQMCCGAGREGRRFLPGTAGL